MVTTIPDDGERVMIYSNNPEKIAVLKSKLENDHIEVFIEDSTNCMENLDGCNLGTINEFSPDLILIENDEHESGLILYKLIKEEGTNHSIPIVLYGIMDEKVKLIAIGSGVLDVVNDINTEEIYPKIFNYIKIGRKNVNSSNYDKLTGVFNRKYGEKLINESIIIALEANTDLSIMLMDIDNMQHINKVIGKAKGDEIIKTCADYIKHEIETESKNYVFRYLGEKFVIVFQNKTVSEVLKIGLELQEKLNELIRKYKIITSFSAGISTLNPKSNDYISMINNAIESQLAAKKNGKAKIYIHDSYTTLKNRNFILIVDRDSAIVDILASRYKNKGYKVFSALDSEDAISIMKSNEIDLLITDFEPFIEIAEYLKENMKEQKHEKIIVLATSKIESALQNALNNGADEYIQKPFSIVELDLKIQKLLG